MKIVYYKDVIIFGQSFSVFPKLKQRYGENDE